ncbi:MAG TPA: MCP four helix bundle domain-containing protein, partial [Thermodesulfobacteriota bacterium]|nr:MCP four helix bundle domain-containing protein [Thermodesulfobacteriota bacterium]
MLKNMKIGMRLGVGFGVIALLLAVVAVLSITRLASIGNSVDQAVNDRYPKTEIANDIIDQANGSARFIRNMIIFDNKDEIQKESARLDEAAKKIDEDLNKLEKVINTAKGKELFKSIVDSRAPYREVLNQVKKLALEDKKKEAGSLLGAKLRPLQLVYMDNVMKF